MRISDWSSDVCSSDLTSEGSWVNVYIVGVVATPFVMDPVDLGSSSGEPGITGGPPRIWVDPPQLLPSLNVGGIEIDTGDNRTIKAPEGFDGCPSAARPCPRSEARRGGKECVSKCRSRGWP